MSSWPEEMNQQSLLPSQLLSAQKVELARGDDSSIFLDFPHMPCGSKLNFRSKIPAKHYITSIPTDGLVHHVQETVLCGQIGEFIGARCSLSLPANMLVEHRNIYRQMEEHYPFLLQGANFVVTGVK